MKILFLHGFLQTGEHMKSKTGQLRKLFKNTDFVYPDGPFKIISNGDKLDYQYENLTLSTKNEMKIDNAPGNRFGWIPHEKDELTKTGIRFQGLQEAVKVVQQLIEEHKPTRIIAFSQSATVILYMLKQKLIDSSIKCLLVSPYFFTKFEQEKEAQDLDLIYEGSQDNIFTCMYGQTDDVLKQDVYQSLRTKYPNCYYKEHEGGHFVACSGELKDFWRTWAQE
ncbi:Serine_hydrolase (FSH1) family protein [Hexamita inflata]|uniref:Serine hydrolase (FSH1) family protein n=1 Tax=Hexamita inflata TaxID=28002 RepID=A0AA86P890_9EUKA|nr:Serine hydrolase (FSH1) family protein [Hexamita inflata]